ncbi:cysteine-rich receptor-like protein kinase 21 isoform X2 [Panicum virgatum]|uniref:cysteine-rich receptor-like protein kinase 21 isoform X2 n=1 Tax=Panicum virgatum TaxID=38727 RepID=UPI0019D51CF4|nr:cysteine-rich receptor-like protein kinase 21 isoform X2 [Panicum virgatum]
MDHEAFKLHHLERMLFDENAEPADLPLSLLEAITKIFSNDQEIGRGGYAVVYQGLLRNGTVAVKKLLDFVDFDDQKFIREIDCLMRVKHKNIIRFLGYCSDTQGKLFSFDGKIVMAECRQRFLCFEYASGGSLENYITDVSTGLEWQKRYSIIRGICEGLHYLHRMHIVHLDLKPSNILLDNDMVPKISDFGYSRSFHENQTRAITKTLVGSIGYLAPEFFNGEITYKIDIYALGVIITEILTGKKGYASVVDIMELNILERIVAGSDEPDHLDLPLLQRVTENFSEKRKIGVGRWGDVYKGILRNGIVAVKRLFKSRAIKNKMFHREVKSLITVRHQNIVRFLGYCSFTEERMVSIEGGTIVVDIQERLLCFEYMSNGSLDSHLTDELRGLEWHTRYEIIVGICKGLLHLHKEKDVIHMDLKPANILLDDHMVPKITDFGLSRLDNNSSAKTTSLHISLGYSAPEYVLEGKSSSKSDIYSLGVIIIEVVTGSKQKMPNITKSLRRWRYRWNKSAKHTPLGYQQVSKCLELADKCTQVDPKDRPDISNIIDELNLTDNMEDQFQVIPCFEGMLEIDPLEIHISLELDQQIWKSIELTNDTDDCLAFVTKASLQCLHIEPDKSIVPPRSKCNVTITMMQEHVMALPNNHYTEEITVLSTRVNGGLTAGDITEHMFSDRDGNVVDEVNVVVVFGTPPLGEEF